MAPCATGGLQCFDVHDAHGKSPVPVKRPLLAVLPGNPGDAVFYGDFVRALESHGHEVTVTSHLATHDAQHGLLPYARHQAEAISRYLIATGRSVDDVDLVLVGHSVGAYLGYLLAARRLLPVARLFLIFPFLARPALSGRLLLKLLSSPGLVAVSLRLWRALPRWLQRRLIAGAGAGAHGAWVEAAMATEQPRAWVAMARAEAAEIASRPDASYLTDEPLLRDPDRVTCVLCPRDRWAPLRPAPLDTEVVPGVSHAFVVDPAQCQVVARLIARRLTRRRE
jgi:pimeloyl-ACP methyl ester carboxylesterase